MSNAQPVAFMTGNTDPDTKDAYPYAVVPAVASITIDDETTYYATFADAISAAGENDEIIVLDATAEQTNPDWKIAGGKLVRKLLLLPSLVKLTIL